MLWHFYFHPYKIRSDFIVHWFSGQSLTSCCFFHEGFSFSSFQRFSINFLCFNNCLIVVFFLLLCFYSLVYRSQVLFLTFLISSLIILSDILIFLLYLRYRILLRLTHVDLYAFSLFLLIFNQANFRFLLLILLIFRVYKLFHQIVFSFIEYILHNHFSYLLFLILGFVHVLEWILMIL